MARASVIVPVYNVERHLDECLRSVVGQTLSDIEIVCVNDGSTDGSRSLLAAHARRDGRIRVIDQDNAGLSAARNAGIEAASAPYVCFVDSDDRLVPHALERIVAELDESGADLLTFGANPFPPEYANIWLRDVLSPRTVTYEGFSIDLLFKERSRPFAWRTACRASFLSRARLRFDETVRYGEDQVFHFAAYPRAGRTRLISDKLYDYRLARADSLMGRFADDPAGLHLAHVAIVRSVYDDWAGQGILDRYAAEMVAWTIELIAFNVLRLGDADNARVFGELAEVLLDHWSRDELRALPLGSTDARIVEAVVSGRLLSPLHRWRLRSAHFRAAYGTRAWLAWLSRGCD